MFFFKISTVRVSFVVSFRNASRNGTRCQSPVQEDTRDGRDYILRVTLDQYGIYGWYLSVFLGVHYVCFIVEGSLEV